MYLCLENKKKKLNITIDVPDFCMRSGSIFLEPNIIENGILKVIRKARIIKDISGMIFHDNQEVPIATLNIGKLREYDSIGVSNYINKYHDMRGYGRGSDD